MRLTSKPNSNLTFDKRHTPHIECLCLRNKRPQNANEAQRNFVELHMNFVSFLWFWLHDMHLFRKTNSILPFGTFSVGTRPESAAFLRFTITWSSVFTSSLPWKGEDLIWITCKRLFKQVSNTVRWLFSRNGWLPGRKTGREGEGMVGKIKSQLKMALRIFNTFSSNSVMSPLKVQSL